MQVCSTQFAFHALLSPKEGIIESILASGLRPLSDFPDSERWRAIEAFLPGFFEKLYYECAQPVIHKPYLNSGIFLSSIDFQRIPGSLMHNKTRIKIPLARIDPDYAAMTYELDSRRVALPLTEQNLQATAELWTDALVKDWFGRDQNRLFYYVPQIATYQPGGIPVEPVDIEQFAPNSMLPQSA